MELGSGSAVGERSRLPSMNLFGQTRDGCRRRINTSMNDARTPSNDDQNGHRWIVNFTNFKTRDKTQSRVIEELGPMAHEVVRVWLNVVTPDAIVREPPGKPIQSISFSSRSQMRRFINLFGGRHFRPA